LPISTAVYSLLRDMEPKLNFFRSAVNPYLTYDGDREKSSGQAHLRSM
jgi:hypothetical protein